jgi:S-formylglutathione hydrolase
MPSENSPIETLKEHASFGGVQGVYRHRSSVLDCEMQFSVYLPPVPAGGPAGGKVPVLYFLSGLTCTWENFTAKAGAQIHAARHGIMLVMPDTSPRGPGVPDVEGRYDLGMGAGFYVDATQSPWSSHYRMYSYVTRELPDLVEAAFPADGGRRGIFGHSMGGHGALVCAFRNPDRYRSVSAFSPICSPTKVQWGQDAFTTYLGPDTAAWRDYDAVELAASTGWRSEVLVDQGLADEFLDTQLRPDLLEQATAAAGIPARIRRQAGYDHSYYFISSFVGDHIAHHAEKLAGLGKEG